MSGRQSLLDSATVPQRRGAVAEVHSSSSRVVVLALDDPGAPPFALDGSAVVIWQAIDARRDLAAITRAVAEHYAVPATEVTLAVRAFLEQLIATGLVEPKAGLPSPRVEA